MTKIKQHISPITGHKLTTVQTGDTEWESLDSVDKFPLTNTELERVNKANYDSNKLAMFKKLLIKGLNKTAIAKQSGSSRKTVQRYLPLLDKETLELIEKINQKTHEKPTKNPQNFESGSWLLLSFNDLGIHVPLLISLCLLLLFVFGWQYWTAYRKRYLIERELWLMERGKYHTIFCKVLDLKYNKDVILCKTEKEQAYYRKLCLHYKNGRRDIVYFPKRSGESWTDYDHRQKHYREATNLANSYKINAGDKERAKEFKKHDDLGLLDYIGLGTYKYKNWLESKVFIISYCEYYIKHQRPMHGNYKKSNSTQTPVIL